ncbi:IS110 family transposase [Amaricoccus tamworthensis]|uniref:IS110 family transposase n=1 Tax=Amaricoccus tamworthensis TaxID=57002 RepID=UPI003C7BE7A0
MTRIFVGVDLSKDWLDIFDPRRGNIRRANTPAGVKRFLSELDRGDMVVFEATSGCDGLLLRSALGAGIPFHRVNPLHAWHFARSLNLPKTDRVDARMLARMGAERAFGPSPVFLPERAELAELSGRRDQLKRMETQERNRLAKASTAAIRADITASLRAIARRIRKIEAAIDAFVAAHPRLARQLDLLETVPGIARVTSVTLLSHMPELGTLDRHTVASLGGLAPRARESGRWRGQRFTGDGRRQIRRGLYMAAVSAMSHRRLCPAFVERLRAKGKPGKVIAVAVARKLLTIANAVLRDQKPWQPAT